MGVNGTNCMSVEDMRKEIDEHCEQQHDCLLCCLNQHPMCFTIDGEQSEELVRGAYEKLHPPTPVVEVEEPTPTSDMVQHPNHYNREDAMECIEEMIMLFGKEAVKHFCLCNIHKYRYRASDKNGDEDIKKSDFYVKLYKELCDGQ